MMDREFKRPFDFFHKIVYARVPLVLILNELPIFILSFPLKIRSCGISMCFFVTKWVFIFRINKKFPKTETSYRELLCNTADTGE
jgi:hypothetical protein